MRTYRDLRRIPLTTEALNHRCVMTMAIGQWDALLSRAYDAGWVLLELDDDERPVRAFQRKTDESGMSSTP